MIEDNSEKWIHEMLRQLEHDYHKARQPFIDMLVCIESLKPPNPIIISKEQWELLKKDREN